jgi:hypothetical protein
MISALKRIAISVGLAKPQTFAEWLAENPEPSLTELVERFGGYARIPTAAWIDFDRRMERWQYAYQRRHREEEGQ